MQNEKSEKCRNPKCDERIERGYSWRGYCVVCAEARQGGIAPATGEMMVRLLRGKRGRR